MTIYRTDSDENVGQVANLRTDCQSVHPGAARTGSRWFRAPAPGDYAILDRAVTAGSGIKS
jgi:hypothetical protein